MPSVAEGGLGVTVIYCKQPLPAFFDTLKFDVPPVRLTFPYILESTRILAIGAGSRIITAVVNAFEIL